MTSSLTFFTRSVLPFLAFPWARAAFLPKRVVLVVVDVGADGVVNCSVADLTGAAGSEGANAFTLVELKQSKALRRTKISFIILEESVWLKYAALVLAWQ